MQFNEPKRIIHFYDRFMIHLNYFLDYLDRSRDDNQSLLDMEDHIKQSYPKAFEIGSKIYDDYANILVLICIKVNEFI